MKIEIEVKTKNIIISNDKGESEFTIDDKIGNLEENILDHLKSFLEDMRTLYGGI